MKTEDSKKSIYGIDHQGIQQLTEEEATGAVPLTSGSFLGKKSKLVSACQPSSVRDYFPRTPVLIDALQFTCRVIAGDYQSKEKFYLQEAPQELSVYFADPHIYPTHKNRPLLKVCGRKRMSTNGARLLRAETDDPIPHQRGQEKTIENSEKKNQLSVAEINEVVRRAKEKGYSILTWQISTAFEALSNVREWVISENGLEGHNPPHLIQKHVMAERIEVYFELQFATRMDSLVAALERAICNYLGPVNKKRQELKRSYDAEDRDYYCAWLIPQKKFNEAFSGKGEFKFKVYKKGDRIRVEIQANYPRLKRRVECDPALNPYVAPAIEAFQVAEVLGNALELIWDDTVEFIDGYDPNSDLREQLSKRLSELLPTKSKHKAAEMVVAHIVDMGSITLADLESFGWSRNDLKTMSDSDFGFLVPYETGFREPGKKKGAKQIRRGVFRLVPERLGLTGKPRSQRRHHELNPPLIAQAPKTIDPLLAFTGSARIDPESPFLHSMATETNLSFERI